MALKFNAEIVSPFAIFLHKKDHGPIEDRTTSVSATVHGTGYCVQTSRANWYCVQSVVVASGACAQGSACHNLRRAFPKHVNALNPAPSIANPRPTWTRRRIGGWRISNGCPTGSENKAAAMSHTLRPANTSEWPRQYRGFDIQWWMDPRPRFWYEAPWDGSGMIQERARRVPSLQLIGSKTRPDHPWIEMRFS